MRRSRSALLSLLLAGGTLGAPAAQACRIGGAEILFPAIPAEIYDADFVAEAMIIEEISTGSPSSGKVAFEVVNSETHPEFEGRIVTGRFIIDSCGPYVRMNTNGFLIGKVESDGAPEEFEVRLFKVHVALGSLITDDGRMPLIPKEE